MELFEIKKDIVTFSPQALTLEPFHKLWVRDTSKDKSVAVAELAAIYFYADYKSDFSTIVHPEEKLEMIKSVVVGLPDNWVNDETFDEAVSFYKEMQKTISTILLEDARQAVSTVSSFLRTIDLNEVDGKGKPVHDVKKVADTLGNINRITESLAKLEEQVKKDILEKADKLRGNKPKAVFEDGL